MHEQCVAGPPLSFVGPGNEAMLTHTPSPCADVCMKGALLLQLLLPTPYQPSGMVSTLATTSHSSFLVLRPKQQEKYSMSFFPSHVICTCMIVLFLTDPSSSPALLPGQSASEVGLPCGHVDCH